MVTEGQKRAGRATDALSAAERVRLHELIGQIERETSAEICVMLVRGSHDPAALATHYFAHLGIGKKDLDNGVLILVVLANRRIEILIGRGLRAVLPQPLLDQIVNNILTPHFREDQFGSGLLLAVETLGRALSERLPDAGRRGADRIPNVIELEGRESRE